MIHELGKLLKVDDVKATGVVRIAKSEIIPPPSHLTEMEEAIKI